MALQRRWKRYGSRAQVLIAHYPFELLFLVLDLGIIICVHVVDALRGEVAYPWWLRFGKIQSHPMITPIPSAVLLVGMLASSGKQRHDIRHARVVAWTYWVFGALWGLVVDPVTFIFFIFGRNVLRVAQGPTGDQDVAKNSASS